MTPETVLFVTPTWTRNGGVATHVMASAAALVQRGLDVHVLAERIEAAEPTPGVTLHHVGELFNSELSPELRVGDAVPAATSVIHLHQFYDPLVVAHLQRSAPVVISAHGYPACTSGVHYFRPGQECTRAHGVGCVPSCSRQAARTYATRARCRAPFAAPRGRSSRSHARIWRSPTRARSIAISRSTACSDARSCRCSRRWTPAPGSGHEQRRRVVFAGRVVAPKGVDVLIRAARRVDAEFVICGDGLRLECDARARRRLGLEQPRLVPRLARQRGARPRARRSVGRRDALGLARAVRARRDRGVRRRAPGRRERDRRDRRLARRTASTASACRPATSRALARALERAARRSRQAARMGAGREMVAARFSVEHHVAALVGAYDARARWQSLRAARRPRARRRARATRRAKRARTSCRSERADRARPGGAASAALHLAVVLAGDDADRDPRGQAARRSSAREWDVTVLTETARPPRVPPACGPMRVEVARGGPARLLAALRRLRLDKLIELLVWPDESIFWVLSRDPCRAAADRRDRARARSSCS